MMTQNLSLAYLLPPVMVGVGLLLLPLFRLGSGAPVPRSFLQRSSQLPLNSVALSAKEAPREGHALEYHVSHLRPSFTAFANNKTTAQQFAVLSFTSFEKVDDISLQPAHSVYT